jgi:hypothetical protein
MDVNLVLLERQDLDVVTGDDAIHLILETGTAKNSYEEAAVAGIAGV